MVNGLYKDNAGSVLVGYDGKFVMRMRRADYEDHDYKPKYASLPTRQQYEKATSAKGT